MKKIFSARTARLFAALLLLLVGSVLLMCAYGEEAQDITSSCSFLSNGKKTTSKTKFLDGKYSTYEKILAGRAVEVDAGEKKVGGLLVRYDSVTCPIDIQIMKDGAWTSVASCGTYLCEWVPLPESASQVRLAVPSDQDLRLTTLTVYGEGEKPASVPVWRELDDCDLLVFVAHPDDELLWLGGLLPMYAGERGLKVQVVYAIKPPAERKLELLDGLWTCGIDAYPINLGRADRKEKNVAQLYDHWGRDVFYNKLTEAIRRYKPEVIVTHAFNGEYGHPAHKACAEALSHCISYAANASKYPASAKAYGTWQVEKVYMHNYKENGNELHLDWNVPLSAFGGETAISVTTRALECHKSQTRNGRWTMDKGVKYTNDCFGLYFTTVGQDEACDDLMEHTSVIKIPDPV